jgi:hypothetical protein
MLKEVNKIIDIAVVNQEVEDVGYTYCGDGNVIKFSSENANDFQELLTKIHKSKREFLAKSPIDDFKDIFWEFFLPHIIKKKAVSQATINSFIEHHGKIEELPFKVMRGIEGITLLNPKCLCQLGCFSIYSSESKPQLVNNVKDNPVFTDEMKKIPEYFIEYEAIAINLDLAVKYADIQFKRFEYVINFLLCNLDHTYEIRIFNYSGRKPHIALVSDSNEIHVSYHGAYKRFEIDNGYVVNKNMGYDLIWRFIGSEKLNNFHQKIISAIEWLGQSIIDNSLQHSFLKAAIALEIIFTYNDKTIINASIMSKISESVALILGDSIESRCSIESTMKKLYGLRSAITHSGKGKINEQIHQEIIIIAKHVIITLLIDDYYKDITSIDQLYVKLKKIKYSGETPK